MTVRLRLVVVALGLGAASFLGCNSERTVETVPVDERHDACTAWCELMRDCYGAVVDDCVEPHCLPEIYRFPACDELATVRLYCWADLSCEEYDTMFDENGLTPCDELTHEYGGCVAQEAAKEDG